MLERLFSKASSREQQNSQSASASVPLLSDPEDQAAEEEKSGAAPKGKENEGYSGADYKTSFSHFVVRSAILNLRRKLTKR